MPKPPEKIKKSLRTSFLLATALLFGCAPEQPDSRTTTQVIMSRSEEVVENPHLYGEIQIGIKKDETTVLSLLDQEFRISLFPSAREGYWSLSINDEPLYEYLGLPHHRGISPLKEVELLPGRIWFEQPELPDSHLFRNAIDAPVLVLTFRWLRESEEEIITFTSQEEFSPR